MKEYKSPAIHRTPLYRVKAAYAAYANMLRRCGNKTGTDPAYANVELRMTLRDFKEWALPRYVEFMALHPKDVPSISRFGDKGHYEIGNIGVISVTENRRQQVHPAPAKKMHGTLS